MPIQNYLQASFTGGEFSPKLLGRPDLAKYASGAEQIENLVVMPWGGVRRRGGTLFVGNTKNDAAVLLRRFVFSTTQAYMLEFGPSYIRIYTSAGVLTESGTTITDITSANPGVVTAAGHGLTNGNRVLITGVSGMTEVNNREFTVAGATANTFQLSGVNTTGYTAYTTGGTVAEIIEVSSPYGASDLASLDFTQSADTLYITHPSYKPRTLVRNSATSWTLSEASIANGPFLDINVDDSLTVYLSGGSATAYGTYAEGDTGITMTASSALFNANHVGALFRLYVSDSGGGWTQLVGDATTIAANRVYENAGNVYACTADTMAGSTWDPSQELPTHTRGTVRAYEDGNTSNYADMLYIHDGSVIVRVTAYSSPTVAEVEIVRNDAPEEVIGSGNATAIWEEGAWSAHRGWPSHTTFFEERLWFAKTSGQPQTVWGSQTGAFLDFLDGDDDAAAITFTIASDQVEAIQWLSSGRVFNVGTTGGEYLVAASETTQPLTPGNLSVRRQSSYGSADGVRPARIGEILMFPQRHGDNANGARIIREHGYSLESDSYNSRNITLIADHITGTGGIKQLAYQQSPYSVLWARRSDGVLAALTWEREQQVLAWHRHTVGGVSDGSGNAAIVEQIETIPGSNGDDLWMVVQRYVNGATVRHIERVTVGLDDDGSIANATFLDAHLSYSGASTSTITGLWHLRGETVRVFYNGEDQGTVAVSSTGSVTLSDSVTAAVLGYGFTWKLKSLRLEAGIASGTAQGKRKRISEMTARMYQSYGGNFGGDSTRTDAITYDNVALFTGDKRLEHPDGWGYDGQFYFEENEAYPMVLLAVVAEVRGSG